MTYLSALMFLAMLFAVMPAAFAQQAQERLNIGWAQVDITPQREAALAGMTSLRLASTVESPLMAAALAIEAPYQKDGAATTILVGCDLRGINRKMLAAIRESLAANHPQIDPHWIIVNSTHSHNAPPLGAFGLPVEAMLEPEYVAFAAPRIADAIAQAWNNRKPGGISFGLSHAVVGHNRIMAFDDGKSKMSSRINDPHFSHVEGYEDHAVNLLYTWDAQGKVTGVVVNASVTAQTMQSQSVISADFWHDTRIELRKKLGENLFVLPQCAASGDQMSAAQVDRRAEGRMEKLMGLHRKQMIARRLTDAVMSIYPVMQANIEWSPVLKHHWEIVPLTRRQVSQQDVDDAHADIAKFKPIFEKGLEELKANPSLIKDSKWVRPVTAAHRNVVRANKVIDRFALQQTEPRFPVEGHTVRIGDMALTTNPFEFYLDFGVQIKARSKAVQTFVVQMANGYEGYVPTARSVAGGAYGAVPASTEVGPEGGKDMVDWALQSIDRLWETP